MVTAEVSSETAVELSLPQSIGFDIDRLQHRDGYQQKKTSSLFLLKLKEERMLTQSAVNDVVAGCQEVFQHTVSRLKAGVSRSFAEHGTESSVVEEIDHVFDDVSDPFDGLETAYLQEKFVVQDLGCIVSVRIASHCTRVYSFMRLYVYLYAGAN